MAFGCRQIQVEQI